LESALKDRFAIVLATAHKEFSVLTGKFLSQFGIKMVIDGRNFLDKDDIMNYGIYYKGIGR
jgi:UDP-N-acetyl-D-mannosaminuronate dehydrogenase